MKSNRMMLVLFVTLGFTLNCERNFVVSDNQTQKTGDISRISKDAVITSNNTFGLELIKNVIEAKPDTNLMISPLSVSLALSMTLNGAAGETESAMKKTLGFETLTLGEVNQVQKELMQRLLTTDPKVLFEIANSIWYRENYPVLQSFLDVNQEYYNAEIRELDFSSPEAVTIINDWISDATHGKIEEMIDRIDPTVVMFLINALYFKGLWKVEFNDSLTNSETFYGYDQTHQVQMMHRKDSLAYYENDRLQAVELPYGEGQYSMMILLPKETETVASLLNEMSLDVYQNICQNLTLQDGDLGLPKIKIEFKILLNDILKALGMEIAFGASADFSNINGYGNLFISRVIHKTFIEVDEVGTEAAAATVVEIKEFSAQPTGFMMYTNRPFLFFIRDAETNSIVFTGHVASF